MNKIIVNGALLVNTQTKTVKAPLFIGTCYFTSKQAAIDYFKMESTDEETVDLYLKEKLICIGLPPHTNIDDLNVIEGRYWKKEN